MGRSMFMHRKGTAKTLGKFSKAEGKLHGKKSAAFFEFVFSR